MEIYNSKISEQTALALLKIEAVKLSPNDMFTWASGIKSPIYCDNRVILSFPEARSFVRDAFAELIKEKYPDTQVIAGVATGAIAVGVLVAEKLGLPFVYVRPGSKGHGLQNRIEGKLEKGSKTVIIEDLISTGGSSLSAAEALVEGGADVQGMCAVFSYGLPKAKENFEKAQCELTVLSHFDELAVHAVSTNYISEKEGLILKDWKSKL